MTARNELVPRLAATDPVTQAVAALDEHGVVIIEGFLEPGTRDRFNAELDPILEGLSPAREFLNPALGWFFGDKTRHITGVASKSRTFAVEVMCHPTLLGVCDAILGPSCATYQLNIAHVLDRGPGAELQYLHRDEVVWSQMPTPHPELQIASVIALADFTADNGSTVVAPGSHRWPRDVEPRPDQLVSAVMPAGSAVIYLGSTIHGAGANTTESSWRRGMHMSYTLGWLRAEENHYLSTPPDIARTLPRRVQELLGYAAHDGIPTGGGFLGAVDLRDPVDLMAEGRL